MASSSTSRCEKSPKVSFYGSIVLLGLVWLLLVGVLHNETSTTTIATRTRTTCSDHNRGGGRGRRMNMDDGRKSEVSSSVHVDPNFMSKRKVPNGPDPIHNRRAGNSHRPPGRAYRGELKN
ncbi:unnamed protein product [Cuscuta europaea]|uniref:CLAVATA3/ESR (CLE)-related protein 25 n=1 Tax=Cuscuta europaea TaxID=41803 RepID=A0A9P0YQJ2_CUSEU|nr:unnamed protein product [Cuscuta europaea]